MKDKIKEKRCYKAGMLVEDFSLAAQTFYKRRGYQTCTPEEAELNKAQDLNSKTPWVEGPIDDPPFTSEVKGSNNPENEFLQIRQMRPPGSKLFRRWDMVNPYWQTEQGQFGNDATSVELLVNEQNDPLPFANPDEDQVEAQAMDERFEANKDPLSARSVLYRIHPELAAIEEEYINRNMRRKPVGPPKVPHYIQRHTAVRNPIDRTNLFGYTPQHRRTNTEFTPESFSTATIINQGIAYGGNGVKGSRGGGDFDNSNINNVWDWLQDRGSVAGSSNGDSINSSSSNSSSSNRGSRDGSAGEGFFTSVSSVNNDRPNNDRPNKNRSKIVRSIWHASEGDNDLRHIKKGRFKTNHKYSMSIGGASQGYKRTKSGLQANNKIYNKFIPQHLKYSTLKASANKSNESTIRVSKPNIAVENVNSSLDAPNVSALAVYDDPPVNEGVPSRAGKRVRKPRDTYSPEWKKK